MRKPYNQKLYLDFEQDDYVIDWYFGYMDLNNKFDLRRQYGYSSYSFNIKHELEHQSVPYINWELVKNEFFKEISKKKKK